MRPVPLFILPLSLSTILASMTLAQDDAPAASEEWEDFESDSYKSKLDPAWGASTGKGPEIYPPGMAYGGFDLGVPILLGDVDRDLIRPGADLHIQSGLDLGYVGFFLHGGFRFIPVDFDRAADAQHPDYHGQGRDPLKNPYFGFGIRAQVPNHTLVMPYISGSFDFDFWHFRDTTISCGGYYYWWCVGHDVYEFTPGFSGRAGLAFHLGQCLYVDVGLNVSMSFKGDFFSNNQAWVEPFSGVMCRR
jgi:hypothetical protein